MDKVSRRRFLSSTAAGAGIVLLTANGCTPSAGANGSPSLIDPASLPAATNPEAPDEKTLIANMQAAATHYFESLDADQQQKTAYAFDDNERFHWHWTTPSGFPRNGLPLREMNEEQQKAALALLQASISHAGLEKSLDIMSLQRDLGNDPELYFVTLFGTPGTSEPWGWRWEGHHLSRHFTVVGDQVAMTPFFHGSWPTTSESGLRAMAREEDAALELVNSLPEDARAVAIFQAETLTNHVTQNDAKVTPLDPVGIAYGELNGDQKARIVEIMHAYLSSLPEKIATPSFQRINDAGLDEIRFGWAGSLEHQRPQYYRLQGPTFLLEFDNSRNRGTHIHSVWRDFERDFGYNLL